MHIRVARIGRPSALVIVLVVMVLFLVFPFVVMLTTALKSAEEVVSQPTFFPRHPDLLNFVTLWQQVGLAQLMANSLVIGGGSAVIATAVAIMAGYSVSRYHFRGRTGFLATMLITQMFSPVVLLLPLFRLFSLYGLLDTRFGLVLVNTAFDMPFAVYLMSRYLATVPKELEEAAYVDGASEIMAMLRVVAPLAVPGIVVAFIFSFMTSWNEFTFALTFMTSDSKMPVTLGLYEFVGHFSIQWNYLMGACLIAAIPPTVLFILIQKNLMGGLTSGSLNDY